MKNKKKPSGVLAAEREARHAAQVKLHAANQEILRMHALVRESNERADKQIEAFAKAVNIIYGNLCLQFGQKNDDGSRVLRAPIAMAESFKDYVLVVSVDRAAGETVLRLKPREGKHEAD